MHVCPSRPWAPSRPPAPSAPGGPAGPPGPVGPGTTESVRCQLRKTNSALSSMGTSLQWRPLPVSRRMHAGTPASPSTSLRSPDTPRAWNVSGRYAEHSPYTNTSNPCETWTSGCTDGQRRSARSLAELGDRLRQLRQRLDTERGKLAGLRGVPLDGGPRAPMDERCVHARRYRWTQNQLPSPYDLGLCAAWMPSEPLVRKSRCQKNGSQTAVTRSAAPTCVPAGERGGKSLVLEGVRDCLSGIPPAARPMVSPTKPPTPLSPGEVAKGAGQSAW